MIKKSNKKTKPKKEEKISLLVEKLNSDNERLKDEALRAHAEMENLRKRTAKEIQASRNYGITNFAKSMLDVNDNLARAIEAVPDIKRKEGSNEFKALIEGVEMTQRQMLLALEANGVKKQQPMGKKFDPNFHQAMFEVENKQLPNNSVAQIMQDGYEIGGRVLRPAMVGVAKGGPDIIEEETEDEADKSAADSVEIKDENKK